MQRILMADFAKDFFKLERSSDNALLVVLNLSFALFTFLRIRMHALKMCFRLTFVSIMYVCISSVVCAIVLELYKRYIFL